MVCIQRTNLSHGVVIHGYELAGMFCTGHVEPQVVLHLLLFFNVVMAVEIFVKERFKARVL